MHGKGKEKVSPTTKTSAKSAAKVTPELNVKGQKSVHDIGNR
jgi:hypothetical protein